MADKHRDGTEQVGIRNGKSRLTEDLVLQLHRCWQAGGITQQELADDMGVSRSAVEHVLAGRTWTHLLERI
jgi:plasmid maintenance system antidote protein VapI